MRLLVIDNYDSFTYNLVHLVEKVSSIPFDVVKNDQIGIDQVAAYNKILLSPGPGLPSEAGIMPEVIKRYHQQKSIFGVCLGLQAIGQSFGCKLKNLSQVYHGIAMPVNVINNDSLFNHCPARFAGGRYHSWVIDQQTLTPELEVTAVDDEQWIMALRHRRWDVSGVQFHPESILSEYGETIIHNWVNKKD